MNTLLLLKTASGSEYLLYSTETSLELGARVAAGERASRFLNARYPLQAVFYAVGERMVAYGADSTFPSSSGRLSTSRIVEILDLSPVDGQADGSR